MRNIFIITSFMLLMISSQLQNSNAFVLRIIGDLLSNNVAGAPVLHERTEWDFNPEAARHSRGVFYETNGFRSAKFIERIGVGDDGRQHERREEQAQRDNGRLNGEHWINYPVAQ